MGLPLIRAAAGRTPVPRLADDAFISYSHAADGKLAPALQSALQRFAKSWYRRRALRRTHLFIGLGELNDSGHTGTAWLRRDGGQTEVVVNLIEPDEME